MAPNTINLHVAAPGHCEGLMPWWPPVYLLTHLSLDKTAAVSQTTFSNAFSWMKMFEFGLKSRWFFSQCSSLQYSCISSDNGLAPTRRRAIICTNADPIHRRIYAEPGGDELNPDMLHHIHETQNWFVFFHISILRYCRHMSLLTLWLLMTWRW